jgi:hypothetical protein
MPRGGIDGLFVAPVTVALGTENGVNGDFKRGIKFVSHVTSALKIR